MAVADADIWANEPDEPSIWVIVALKIAMITTVMATGIALLDIMRRDGMISEKVIAVSLIAVGAAIYTYLDQVERDIRKR